jgi:hypothetical protein
MTYAHRLVSLDERFITSALSVILAGAIQRCVSLCKKRVRIW